MQYLRRLASRLRGHAFEDVALSLLAFSSVVSGIAGVAWWQLGTRPFGAAMGDALFVGVVAWAGCVVALFVGATVAALRSQRQR